MSIEIVQRGEALKLSVSVSVLEKVKVETVVVVLEQVEMGMADGVEAGAVSCWAARGSAVRSGAGGVRRGGVSRRCWRSRRVSASG